MNLSQLVVSGVLLLGAAQGIVLAILLARKAYLIANRFLASLMLVYSLFVMDAMITVAGAGSRIPHYPLIIAGIPFLFGPLHYLYARFLTDSGSTFRPVQWLHFVPFLIYRIYTVPAFFWPVDRLLERMESMVSPSPHAIDLFFSWAVTLQGLTYMVLTLMLLQEHKHRLKDSYSSLEKQNLDWLRVITWITASVWLVVLVERILLTFFLSSFNLQPIGFLTSVAVYAMGYIGLSKSELFTQQSIASRNRIIESEAPSLEPSPAKELAPQVPEERYAKSGLSEIQAKEHLQALLRLMEQEKPFRSSTLTLQDLAGQLDISKHHLSEIINAHLKENFYDFVNRYRVEAVKKDLADPEKQNLTILSIAYDAGFNSKSTFNSFFKRYTHQTPSRYREQALTYSKAIKSD